MSMAPLELASLSDVARLLGVSRQRAKQIVESYDDFPSPHGTTGRGNVWRTDDVTRWIESHPHRGMGKRRGTKAAR
jgi:predicted DNA-binding transcriptional regulator AlpA